MLHPRMMQTKKMRKEQSCLRKRGTGRISEMRQIQEEYVKFCQVRGSLPPSLPLSCAYSVEYIFAYVCLRGISVRHVAAALSPAFVARRQIVSSFTTRPLHMHMHVPPLRTKAPGPAEIRESGASKECRC